MTEYLTPSNIMFAIGLLGALFSVFLYFKNPQIREDKRATLLEQQVRFVNESNDRRFEEMQKNIQDSFALAQNHTHSVEEAVKALSVDMTQMSREIVRLGVILEERIPKKIMK